MGGLMWKEVDLKKSGMQDFAKILNGLLEAAHALVEEGEGIGREGGSRRGLRSGGRGSIILVLEADLRLVCDRAEVQRRRFRFGGKRGEVDARHNPANRKLQLTKSHNQYSHIRE